MIMIIPDPQASETSKRLVLATFEMSLPEDRSSMTALAIAEALLEGFADAMCSMLEDEHRDLRAAGLELPVLH